MSDEYFKNKYRTGINRLQDWDYSWPAMYYVTICTKDRVCCFGEIRDENVYLSEIGKIVFDCWLNIPLHFENVALDDWIIMPNHLHGIIEILPNDFCISRRDTALPCLNHPQTQNHPTKIIATKPNPTPIQESFNSLARKNMILGNGGTETWQCRVSTEGRAGQLSPKSLSLTNDFTPTVRKFGYLQPKSLSSIIGSFKSAVSKQSHKNNCEFQWQNNYYEHIIRNDDDYARIKQYIADNPSRWASDRNNSVNIKENIFKK